MLTEKDYEAQSKSNKKKQAEMERLGKRVEPYWDEEAHALKKDAPADIVKDYKRFMTLFDELMIKE